MFGTLWAAISGYVGGLLRAIAVFVFVLLLGSVAFFALNELAKLVNGDNINPLSLPIVAIGGVTLLILVLTIVATIFGFLGLTNKDQAMGLPEGSIRSVIALSLIVLFAILAVFLYEGVSGGPGNKIENLSEADRAQFLRDHTTTKDIQSVAVNLVDKEGQPLRNADGSVKNVFTVTYRSEPNSTSNDFAKQLLVILGTLMTAITSFYLGAGTATSAVAAGAQTSDTTKPTLSSINPSHHSIATGATIHLENSRQRPQRHHACQDRSRRRSGDWHECGLESHQGELRPCRRARSHRSSVGRCRRRWRIEVGSFAGRPHDLRLG